MKARLPALGGDEQRKRDTLGGRPVAVGPAAQLRPEESGR